MRLFPDLFVGFSRCTLLLGVLERSLGERRLACLSGENNVPFINERRPAT